MLGGFLDRCCAREGADRIDQIAGRVRCAALAAVVSILVGGLADRTSTFDETVGQEGTGLRIEQLLDIGLAYQAFGLEFCPYLAAQLIILIGVRRAVVIELDTEAGEVLFVGGLHLGDEFEFRSTLLPGPDHDRRSMGVVGADEDAASTGKLLETDPNIGLDVLDQMADMDMAVGVGQGGGDQEFLAVVFWIAHEVLLWSCLCLGPLRSTLGLGRAGGKGKDGVGISLFPWRFPGSPMLGRIAGGESFWEGTIRRASGSRFEYDKRWS